MIRPAVRLATDDYIFRHDSSSIRPLPQELFDLAQFDEDMNHVSSNLKKGFMHSSLFSILLFALFFLSCSEDSTPAMDDQILPSLSVRAAITTELEENSNIIFEVTASPANFTKEISFVYNTRGITAEPDVDFTASSGTITIPVGTRSVAIPVTILGDDEKELPETIRLDINNATNALIEQSFNIGTITDRDVQNRFDEDGYFTPTGYYGYNQYWSDEFDMDIIDQSSYNFDLGDGCPDLCGWGNNELELYTDDPNNVFVQDGKLHIVASEEGANVYHSGRINTKGKVEFMHGRIDIRARVPKGQGIWPALWMLGANIDEVGWPACGEIDIMEAVGHEPLKVHGTAHWGPEGGPNSFKTGTYHGAEEFSAAFHVFTILWEQNNITWYVDEEEYHTLSGADVGNSPYRFDQEFYLLFNLAVGGIWPGNPDETTEFPQSMEIDYVRVFQLK